jgi:hypothetical protein
MPCDEASFRMFIEVLHKRRKEPIYSANSSPLMKLALKDLTKTYAKKASLFKASKRTYDYAYTNTNHTGSALSFCLSMGGTECLGIMLSRALEPKLLTARYVSHNLLSLLGELRNLSMKHRLSMTTEPFAAAIRNIIAAWLEKVLGPFPEPQARATAVMATLAQHTCNCESCGRVRLFLTAQPERVLHLNRIGADNRRHVEAQLYQYARDAVTYTMIRGSPQGLIVSNGYCTHTSVFLAEVAR